MSANTKQHAIIRLIQETHKIGVTGKQVTINGVPCPKPYFVDMLDRSAIDAEISSDFDRGIAENILNKYSIYNALFAAAQRSKTEEERSAIGIDLDRFIPSVCPITGAKFIYDSLESKISSFSYEGVYGGLSIAGRKYFDAQLQHALFSYDPYNLYRSRDSVVNGINLTEVNRYIPPEWRLAKYTPAYNPLLEEFFCHLFPSEDLRGYVYQWIAGAVLKRNETILVLNGVKGVGKGLFCKLIKGLVGADNYTEAAVSALSKEFNTILRNNRAIVFDEIEVDKKAHTLLKRYANSYQTIEGKGVNADKAEETFNSFIISNNDTSDMYLEADDRRFSVADLSNIPLIEVWSQSKIEELNALLDQEEVIGEFGEWLIDNHDRNFSPFKVWKGETFFKLVYNSLANWQRHIVDYCLTEDEPISYTSLGKQYRKTSSTDAKLPNNMSKVEDFLTNYRHLGKFRVGRMEHSDGWELVPQLKGLMEEYNNSLDL